MFKSIESAHLYENSYLSFEFEFFSKLNKREAAAKLARALGKKVKWANDSIQVKPTLKTFTLCPTYSNGYKENTLSTGFMPYHEAVHMFLKISNIIDSIGETNDRCSVKTRIRLDESTLLLSSPVNKLNKFKYLLTLNESKLFELWPDLINENKKVPHSYLYFIRPRDLYNTIVTESFIERMDPVEFSIPESDFFATDFSEINEGQLIINYISGKDYTKKKKEAVQTINLVIENLYKTLSENYSYSIDERRKISSIVNEFKDIVESTRSYFNFKMKYPELSLYIDLKSDQYLIESHYPIIRNNLFKLISGGGLTEAVINYDTRRKALQIKDAKIEKNILIEGVEFYQCEIFTDAKNCLFEGCEISNSKLVECTIFSNNTIEGSKLIECDYLGGANQIALSFLNNSNQKMINAELVECLVYNGVFSLDSTIDSKTKIINSLK
jgi:hypothetical protein